MSTATEHAPVTPFPQGAIAARRILFFGGMFDPPHAGHTRLPVLVRDRLWPGRTDSWLIYIPAARSPHKPRAARAGDDDRIAMLKLAIAGTDRAAIWTDEIDRARWHTKHAAPQVDTPSYTVDTLTRARQALSPALGGGGGDVAVLADTESRPTRPPEFRLLIGADQAAAFHHWRSPRRIIALAPPVVMSRALSQNAPPADATPGPAPEGYSGTALWGADPADSPARSSPAPALATHRGSGDSLRATLESTNAWTPGELDDWERRAIETAFLPFSSTTARAALAAPARNDAALRRMLGDPVLAYINSHGLYRPA